MKFILTIFLTIVLSACANTQRAAMETVYLNEIAESGVAENLVVKADLSDDELSKATLAFSEINKYRAKWEDCINQAEKCIETPPGAIYVDFLRVKQQYFTLEGIVSAHWHLYDATTQYKLKDIQSHAERLDSAVKGLVAEQKSLAAAKIALEYLKVITTIAPRII